MTFGEFIVAWNQLAPWEIEGVPDTTPVRWDDWEHDELSDFRVNLPASIGETPADFHTGRYSVTLTGYLFTETREMYGVSIMWNENSSEAAWYSVRTLIQVFQPHATAADIYSISADLTYQGEDRATTRRGQFEFSMSWLDDPMEDGLPHYQFLVFSAR